MTDEAKVAQASTDSAAANAAATVAEEAARVKAEDERAAIAAAGQGEIRSTSSKNSELPSPCSCGHCGHLEGRLCCAPRPWCGGLVMPELICGWLARRDLPTARRATANAAAKAGRERVAQKKAEAAAAVERVAQADADAATAAAAVKAEAERVTAAEAQAAATAAASAAVEKAAADAVAAVTVRIFYSRKSGR